ncbi:biopolymer transporter ExbD [Hahella sp. SMD15-11]|uniref:Biopolymer transporter ExbD n=1 Tax=Thermohahella caldifontis TaxID=3142973 RepID=A0AB39UZX2_9GAMM
MRHTRHRRLTSSADLDITAFMNLMIVLVPVLLLNMVFARTTVIELNFPKGLDNPETRKTLQLQLAVTPDQLLLADNLGGIIKRLPNTAQGPDLETLRETLKQVKARLPEKRSLTLMVDDRVDYQTLVTLMDTVRSYPTVVAAQLVQAELFPEISVTDLVDAVAANGEGT